MEKTDGIIWIYPYPLDYKLFIPFRVSEKNV